MGPSKSMFTGSATGIDRQKISNPLVGRDGIANDEIMGLSSVRVVVHATDEGSATVQLFDGGRGARTRKLQLDAETESRFAPKNSQEGFKLTLSEDGNTLTIHAPPGVDIVTHRLR